ncbi:MAG TPA: hypothetical protein VHB25_07200 [Gemmatimonadaceae bacterium]|nr:hypothetical protein [Gemmatimonadaceae bacterium]
MRLRPIGSVLLVAVAPAIVSAQGRVVDEGTFTITRAAAAPQSESFKIVRFGGDSIRATGQVTAGAERINTSLTVDTLGTPISYALIARQDGSPAVQVKAVARAGRLAVVSSDQHGMESQREFPMASGHCVIVESGLEHQLYFVPFARRDQPLWIVSPRSVNRVSAVVAPKGLEPITIAGRSVTATHYSLGSGAARQDFWVDAAGRLLRVEIPAEHLVAQREELPR